MRITLRRSGHQLTLTLKAASTLGEELSSARAWTRMKSPLKLGRARSIVPLHSISLSPAPAYLLNFSFHGKVHPSSSLLLPPPPPVALSKTDMRAEASPRLSELLRSVRERRGERERERERAISPQQSSDATRRASR